jgi:hypothetical protein
MAIRFLEEAPKSRIRFIEEPKLVKSRGETGARRFVQQPLQGATLGFADEISGTLGAILAKGYDEVRALTGQERLFDEGEDVIGAGIDNARADVQQQVQERPVESIGLQLLGGVAGGAAGAGTKAGQAIGSDTSPIANHRSPSASSTKL